MDLYKYDFVLTHEMSVLLYDEPFVEKIRFAVELCSGHFKFNSHVCYNLSLFFAVK